jgi:enamine deaminase RidA (YjgF/YER057c/UK114 family)
MNTDIKRIEPREWNSRAVVYENLVFLSGIVADDKSVPVKEQTEQVLATIDKFLVEAGTDKTRILTSTVYMADLSQKDLMNEAWMAWLDKADLPARAAVGVQLTPNTLVEIMVCATK